MNIKIYLTMNTYKPLTSVTMALETSGERMFGLSQPLIHVSKDDTDRIRVRVNVRRIPIEVQPFITPLLRFMGHKIADYHLNELRLLPGDDWADSNVSHDVLKFPERHIAHSADVTLIIIGVMRWRQCTGFVALQNSHRGVSVHLYMSDHTMHSRAGTSCDVAFQGYDHFRESLKRCVGDLLIYMDSNPSDSVELQTLVRALRTAPRVRYGI